MRYAPAKKPIKGNRNKKYKANYSLIHLRLALFWCPNFKRKHRQKVLLLQETFAGVQSFWQKLCVDSQFQHFKTVRSSTVADIFCFLFRGAGVPEKSRGNLLG